MSTMPSFVIGVCGGEDAEGYSIHIHDRNCKAFKPQQFDSDYIFDGTLRQAIDDYLDEEMREMGWDENIIKTHDCAVTLDNKFKAKAS